MPLPSQKAKTLKEAYRICDVTPLTEADQKYYVPLEARNDVIARLNSILDFVELGESKAILFTGHIGSGKSSELIRVGKYWENEYEVIFVTTQDVIDINDVEYTDLYLLIIKQVEVALRQHGISFRSDLLTSFEGWFREVTNETEETLERSINVEAETSLGGEAPFLAKLLFKLVANIKAGSKDKRTIREVLRQDVSRLKTDINLLLDDGMKKLRVKFPNKKGILVILDDLDKAPKDVAQRLFTDYASQLQDLNCVMIYTVPIGSLYTPRGISKSFEDMTIVPMVKVYKYERDRLELEDSDEGLAAMRQLIESRVEVDQIFESELNLLDLCRACGGHPRFLMQMMRTACLTGSGRAHRKLQDTDIVYAINQLQFRFERELVLVPKAYPVLATIARTKELNNDDVLSELLFSTAVLEYNGDRRWAYPNPLVRRSDLFKQAVEN